MVEGLECSEFVGGYPVHPAASSFPMMSDAELDSLAQDIAENGLHDQIELAYVDWDATELVLIDGRNRFAACERAGVDPSFKIAHHLEPDELTAEIASKNLKRRNLRPGQAAAIAVELLPMYEAEARARKWAGVKQDVHEVEDLGANLHQGLRAPRSAAKAAESMNVSARTVATAKRVKESDPNLFAKIKTGELTPHRASKIIDEQRTQHQSAEEAQAKRETQIQREADRLLKKYSTEEMELLLHYINTGRE